mmetsp:Transcript_7567/g.23372  ORF Transcript_7567/g.23372 Transcript_7567/m.23372 type:complete len:262 (-) Transcript_7567:994-1779(-)
MRRYSGVDVHHRTAPIEVRRRCGWATTQEERKEGGSVHKAAVSQSANEEQEQRAAKSDGGGGGVFSLGPGLEGLGGDEEVVGTVDAVQAAVVVVVAEEGEDGGAEDGVVGGVAAVGAAGDDAEVARRLAHQELSVSRGVEEVVQRGAHGGPGDGRAQVVDVEFAGGGELRVATSVVCFEEHRPGVVEAASGFVRRDHRAIRRRVGFQTALLQILEELNGLVPLFAFVARRDERVVRVHVGVQAFSLEVVKELHRLLAVPRR